MIVFRLSKERYMHDLSGKGAEMVGGRWNSKGNALLYTSSSRALCMAEIAVHLTLGNIPEDYYLVEIEVPDKTEIKKIDTSILPPEWKAFPHIKATKKVGDAFLNSGLQLVLQVPSAVVQGDFNYLFNPRHPEFESVKILKTELFSFDERLFR